MAKPNYAFAKRQRELAKQKKKEEKLKRKADPGASTPGEADELRAVDVRCSQP